MADPTPKEIGELVQELEQEWAALRAAQTTLKEFYLGQHIVEVPKTKVLGVESEAVTAMTGMEVVRRLKGLFGYGEFQVDPAGIGSEARRAAEDVAKFQNAFFPWREDRTHEDTWDLAKDDILWQKVAFTLTLPLFKQYTIEAGYPEREAYKNDRAFNKARDEWLTEQPVPISHKHIPASQALVLLTGDVGIERGVVVNDVSGARVKRLWPDASIAKGMGEAELAKKYRIITYVDSTYCTYAYVGEGGNRVGPIVWGAKGGEVLDSWPHKMGVCPLVMGCGQLTSAPELENRYRCVLDDLMSIAKARDFLWSRQLMQVKIDALNYLFIKSAPNSGVSSREVVTLDQSGPLQLLEGEEPGRWPTAPLQAEAEALEQKMTFQLQRLALTDVLRGLGGKDQSGISYKLMRDAAQNEWTPLGGHLADFRRRQAQMVARAVIALGEPVYIRNSTKDGTERVGCTPELAKDRLEDIHILLNPSFPEDRAADLDACATAIGMGLPQTWAYENLLNESEPQKLQDQAIVEKLVMMASDQLVQEALARAGLKVQQAQGMTPLQVQEATPAASPGLQQAIEGMTQGQAQVPEGGPVV